MAMQFETVLSYHHDEDGEEVYYNVDVAGHANVVTLKMVDGDAEVRLGFDIDDTLILIEALTRAVRTAIQQ